MKIVFLILWGCFLWVSAGRAGLVCEQPSFDYGAVPASHTPKHIFELKNTGTNGVWIVRVRKTCGCVVATPSRREVEPGETAEIRVSISLKGRSGRQGKTIYVHTDSRETPLLKLYARGTIVPEPRAESVSESPVADTKRRIRHERKGPVVVPSEIHLPVQVGAQGRIVRIEIQGRFQLKGIMPPADIPFAVQRGPNTCTIELGPIHDTQALRGKALVILTSSGALQVPCVIE